MNKVCESPQNLILRRMPADCANEPERYSAWSGAVRIGSIGHDPHATTDEKWSWSLTILVSAMTRGLRHGRAADRVEAMRELRRAFDGAGIDLEEALYRQRGTEYQQSLWQAQHQGRQMAPGRV